MSHSPNKKKYSPLKLETCLVLLHKCLIFGAKLYLESCSFSSFQRKWKEY
jgi:hypothetical protein